MNQSFAYYEVSKDIRPYDYEYLVGRQVRVWWGMDGNQTHPCITEGTVTQVTHMTEDPETGADIDYWGFKIDTNQGPALWSPSMGGSIEYA